MLFTDESHFTDFEDVNKNNFKQMKNKAIKIGYADGVNDGRESVFQKGFDQGYKDGLRTSFDLDKFRYFFENISADKLDKNDELFDEKERYKKLNILESKAQQHFKYIDQPEENLDVISDRQQQYLNEIMQTISKTLPKASDLLKFSSSDNDFM